MPRKTVRAVKLKQKPPVVGIIMGSPSDWETMKNAADMLDQFGVPYEAQAVSAHRAPHRLLAYAGTAEERGLKVIIAGAGLAAHLPGVTAALTPIPVLGVPMHSKALGGMDSLLSIVQMPGGIPVGTLAIGNAGATNAALLAVAILSLQDQELAARYKAFRKAQSDALPSLPIVGKKK